MVRRHDSMQNALLVGNEEMFEIDDGAGNDSRRLIRRAAVGIDQDGSTAREMFSEADAHGPHDMCDRIRVVITWNPDENVSRANLLDACFSLWSEWGEIRAHEGVAAGSDVGSQT